MLCWWQVLLQLQLQRMMLDDPLPSISSSSHTSKWNFALMYGHRLLLAPPGMEIFMVQNPSYNHWMFIKRGKRGEEKRTAVIFTKKQQQEECSLHS